MDFVNGWKRTAAHVLIGVAVALFAYFSMRTEASLGRRGVQLAPLEFVPPSQ
jgi:hypothetical protein